MEDYYGILGVARGASEKDIKAAYLKLLRKYPPEKDPAGFQRLRKAYETLSDAKTRAEYNAMSQHGDRINKLLEQGNQAIEDEKYPAAIKCFKEILTIEPSLSLARNRLGLALLYNENFKEAATEYERLVKENPENAIFMYHLGVAYYDLDDYPKAETWLLRAYERDKLNADILIKLSVLYCRQKKYETAKTMLRDAINADGVVEFQDFIYFFELVQVGVRCGQIDEAEKVIAEIKAIIPSDPEARTYVAFKFARLGVDLQRVKKYRPAARMIGWAKEIDPDDKVVQEIYENSKLLVQFEKLVDNESIDGPLKAMLYLYLYGEDLSEADYKKRTEQNIASLNEYIRVAPDELLKEIGMLRREYPALAAERAENLTKLEELASRRSRIYEQLGRLKDDSLVLASIKIMAFLFVNVGGDLSEWERKRRLDEALSDLNQRSSSSIRDSVLRLKSYYPNLYEANTRAFDELLRIANQALGYSTSSSSNSSSGSSTSSSSGSSCFVATAAFGTPWAAEIDVLRRWRDAVLQHDRIGRPLVRLYYRVGPYLAAVVRRSPTLRGVVRAAIRRVIARVQAVYPSLGQGGAAREPEVSQIE